jgi:hypothetical protein
LWVAGTVAIVSVLATVFALTTGEQEATTALTPEPTSSASSGLPFGIETDLQQGSRYPSDWVRVTSTDGRFSVVGPGEPSLHAERGCAVITFASSKLSCTLYVYDLGQPPADPFGFTRYRIGVWGKRAGMQGSGRRIHYGPIVGWRARVDGPYGIGELEVATGGGNEFVLEATRLWRLDPHEHDLANLFLGSIVVSSGGSVSGSA